MGILDNVIILLLIVGAFFTGKLIADRYLKDTIAEYEYIIRVMSAEKGVGYVAPPNKRVPIGQPFMDKLKETGRATQALHRSQTQS